MSLLRRASEPADTLAALVNFTPVPREGYRIGVPQAGAWVELLNSDADLYGGSNRGNLGAVATEPVAAHGHEQSLALTVNQV